MVAFKGNSVFLKLWYFLRTYVLTIPRFDLFLQGALLIVVMLQSNAYMLLRRDAGTGFLRAMIEDWVFIGEGVAEFLCGAVIAWFGSGRRQFALSLWLGLTAVVGLIILALPYAESSPALVALCGGDSISSYSDADNSDPVVVIRTVFLIILVILCSLSIISVWAHGLTYLDDHEPKHGPYFYGILISIRLSLGLSGQNWLRPGAFRDEWWHAQLSLSMLTLMFAILFTLFPTKMPEWEEIDIDEDTGFKATLGRVLRNKPVMLQTVAMAFLYTSLFSFLLYDKEFVQARFHVESIRQDPQTSRAVSDIFRTMVVIFFVMIFRMRFSVRRSDGVKSNTAAKVGGIVAIFVAIFFAVVASLPCELQEISGMESGTFEPPTCSQECGCTSNSYGFTPVCAVDTSTTYFSPCTAGCHEYENLNGLVLFNNCTCGAGSMRAVRGSCSLQSCRSVYGFYLIFYTFIIAVSGAAIMMQGMVMLRAVRRYDKPMAMGASFAIASLLSQGPGHLLYMLISHLTCAYEGIEGGACVFHRPSLWILAVLSCVMAFISGIISLIGSRFRSPYGSTKEIDTN